MVDELEMPSAVRSAVEEHGISARYPNLIKKGNKPKGQPEFIIFEEDGPPELVSDDEEMMKSLCWDRVFIFRKFMRMFRKHALLGSTNCW